MAAEGVSRLKLEEALASQDAQLIELLRSCHDPKLLKTFAQRLARDHRPWVREQVEVLIDQPWNAGGHEPLLKHLFKDAEARKDDERMAVFLARMDRSIRRYRRKRFSWDYQARQAIHYEVLTSPSNTIPNNATSTWASSESIFSHKTRHHLRRRAWRYFRRMGFQDKPRYVLAVAKALAQYEDVYLEKGEHILDSWGLMHACFGESEVIEFTPSHTNVREGQRFGDLAPAPYFPELWQAKPAADVLLSLVTTAKARLVRVWAITLLRRWHAEFLDTLAVERIIAMLDHPDAEVQQLGAELFSNNKTLGSLPIETWLRLMNTTNLTALELIVDAMQRHVTPERLSLPQLVELATARPVPVVRVALRFLQSRRIETDEQRHQTALLANARCEGEAEAIARHALSVIGTRDHYNADDVVRFFDSLLPGMRTAAWAWLNEASPGWTDSNLWSRLIESPYDDVRMKLVEALKRRMNLPGADVAAHVALWCSTLLAVHRGGRTKLVAMGQISRALREHPEDAEKLLPVLAVAIRSVRLPEARTGLAAVVSAIDARPELQALVSRVLPELRVA